MIKIYCMQKNEEDILEQWIIHHSLIVDINNIHIIDNNSNEKCKSILNKYKELGLNVYIEDNYKLKGNHIFNLININNKKFGKHIAIPLDLDEFIAYVPSPFSNHYDFDNLSIVLDSIDEHTYENDSIIKNVINTIKSFKNEKDIKHYMDYNSWILAYINSKYIITDQSKIKEYINSLHTNDHKDHKDHKGHKDHRDHNGRFNFSFCLNTQNEKLYYNDPISEIESFEIHNIGSHNKKFFVSSQLIYLDHGNHFGQVKSLTTDSMNTNLILLHYHSRGIIKLIDKCINDLTGLKYDINNIERIRKLSNTDAEGNHNMKTYIQFIDQGSLSLIQSSNKKTIHFKPFLNPLK